MSITSQFVISFHFIREYSSNLPVSLLQRKILSNGILDMNSLYISNTFNNKLYYISDFIEPFDRSGSITKKEFKIIISVDEIRHFLKIAGDVVFREIQPIVT
jgi:hypothetical protein